MPGSGMRRRERLHTDGIFAPEVRDILDAEDGLQGADVREAERLSLLPAGSRVAVPGAVRAVDNPERSEFVNGDHGQQLAARGCSRRTCIATAFRTAPRSLRNTPTISR